MHWPRLTIAQLMAFVLVVGFGFAALRNASEAWASATFTVAILTVSVALVGAFACNGKSRTAWAGYAVAGGACLVIWLATPSTVGYVHGPPRLLVYWALRVFQSSIQPVASGGAPWIAYAQISHSLEVMILGLAGAVLGRFFAPKADRLNP